MENPIDAPLLRSRRAERGRACARAALPDERATRAPRSASATDGRGGLRRRPRPARHPGPASLLHSGPAERSARRHLHGGGAARKSHRRFPAPARQEARERDRRLCRQRLRQRAERDHPLRAAARAAALRPQERRAELPQGPALLPHHRRAASRLWLQSGGQERQSAGRRLQQADARAGMSAVHGHQHQAAPRAAGAAARHSPPLRIGDPRPRRCCTMCSTCSPTTRTACSPACSARRSGARARSRA